MYRVATLNNISKKGTDRLPSGFEITSELPGADAVLVRSAKMHDLDLPESLLTIARAGAGVNNIPIDKCSEKGIVVFNTPGANANAVKELVLAGLLLSSRDIIGGVNYVQSDKENPDIAKAIEKEKKNFAGCEISGKTLGVIGLGAIGVKVANAASKLGMKVLGCDPYISVKNAWELSRDVVPVKTNDEIFENCDYITVHVPLMDATKGLIGKDAIAKMKDGVVILNFARGGLVDTEAIKEALASGKVKKYVCDFPDAESVKLPNSIMIPHLGASTEEAEDNCAEMAVDEIVDYIENGNIRNSVNFPACDAGPVRSEGRIAILHKNIPNMITQFTAVLSESGVNIDSMLNKSRGDLAYSLFDIEAKSTEGMKDKLSKISGVLKVRIIK